MEAVPPQPVGHTQAELRVCQQGRPWFSWGVGTVNAGEIKVELTVRHWPAEIGRKLGNGHASPAVKHMIAHADFRIPGEKLPGKWSSAPGSFERVPVFGLIEGDIAGRPQSIHSRHGGWSQPIKIGGPNPGENMVDKIIRTEPVAHSLIFGRRAGES